MAATNNETIVSNKIIDSSKKVITEKVKEDFNKLKTAAKDYLNELETLEKEAQKIAREENEEVFQDKYNKSKTLRDAIYNYVMERKEMVTMYNEEEKTEQEIKIANKVLVCSHSFKDSLNNYLGREEYLTYVNSEGILYIYDTKTISKIYQRMGVNKNTSGQTTRGNISVPTLLKYFGIEDNEKYRNEMQDNQIKKEIQRSMENKNEVYQKAMARYNKTQEEVYNYEDYPKTFYWRLLKNNRISGHSRQIEISADISEAYVAAVVDYDNKQVIFSNSNVEKSLQTLSETYLGQKHNSDSGALGGDVSKGNIEFAVKSGTSSWNSESVGDIIYAAKNLVAMKEPITPEELSKMLKDLIRNNPSFLKEVSDDAKEKAEEEIQWLINKNYEITLKS